MMVVETKKSVKSNAVDSNTSLNIVTFCQGNSSKAPRIQYPQSKHYCVLILSINAFDILCTYYQLFTYIEYFFSFS